MQSDKIKAAKIIAGATVIAALISGAFHCASADPEDDGGAAGPAIESQGTHEWSLSDLAATATLNQYLGHLDQLQGRFSERDDFVERTKGTSVRWTGSASNVSRHRSQISLGIDGLDDPSAHASVWFDDSMETRLYGLREGDVVEVRGVIRDASRRHAFLNGESFKLIPQAVRR